MDWLTAAQQFRDFRPDRINRFDLALALFLENYASPFLRCSGYVPLAQRQLLPNLDDTYGQFRALTDLLTGCTPEECEQFHELVGEGLLRRITYREREMRNINRVARCALAAMLVVYLSISLAAIMISPWFITGWCVTVALAYVICITNRHCGTLFAEKRE